MENKILKKEKKEKTFIQNIVISVFGVLVCIIALCSITYAWFTKNASSVENVIESSLFNLEITVTDSDGNSIELTENADGKLFCTFEETGTYTVVLTMTDDTTATKGYCEFSIGSTKLQTKSVSRDEAIGVDPFTFTFEITEANTSVIFEPKWGISADPDISNEDNFLIGDISQD